MSDQPPDLSEQEIAALVARCPAEVRHLYEGWLRGTHHLDGERIDDEEPDMSHTVQEQQTSERRRVRVWFGEHVIADYIAEPLLADQYATAMGRRFAGLKVTNDPLPAVDPNAPRLPSQRLWDIPPA